MQESLGGLNHTGLLGEPSLPAVTTEPRLQACQARELYLWKATAFKKITCPEIPIPEFVRDGEK